MKDNYQLFSRTRARILFILFLLHLGIVSLFSQEGYCYKLNTKALDIGVYNYKKLKKNKFKVLTGEEARLAVEKRIEGNEALIDLVGGYLLEQEIISYYPEVDVALFNDPVITVSVFDLKNIKDGYGDPATYVYSPSGKYRFSYLDADGMKFYLERKVNGEYQLCEGPMIGGSANSFYWESDNVICYLREKKRNNKKGEEITYWIGYATTITPIKCEE